MESTQVLEKLTYAKSAQVLDTIPEDKHELYLHYLDKEETEINRLLEATTTSNVDKVVSVFIPAIKKLARDSFIDKLVGVQPIDDRIAVIRLPDMCNTRSILGVDGGILLCLRHNLNKN